MSGAQSDGSSAADASPEGMKIMLSVYDVVDKELENAAIVRFNNVTRTLGVGGIFHGAIVLGEAEWSFGACERGTGVYGCEVGRNPMYRFREQVELGSTALSLEEMREVLSRLRAEWQGNEYELLTRNCCHFCEALAKELGVGPIPAWLNRFATGTDATIALTSEALNTMRGIGSELQRVGGESVTFLRSSLAQLQANLEARHPSGTSEALRADSSSSAAPSSSAPSTSGLASRLAMGALSLLQPLSGARLGAGGGSGGSSHGSPTGRRGPAGGGDDGSGGAAHMARPSSSPDLLGPSGGSGTAGEAAAPKQGRSVGLGGLRVGQQRILDCTQSVPQLGTQAGQAPTARVTASGLQQADSLKMFSPDADLSFEDALAGRFNQGLQLRSGALQSQQRPADLEMLLSSAASDALGTQPLTASLL